MILTYFLLIAIQLVKQDSVSQLEAFLRVLRVCRIIKLLKMTKLVMHTKKLEEMG